MAMNRFRGQRSGITTGTSLKTLLQLVAAANHAAKLTEVEVSFNGTSNTAEPILVQIARQTTAGTMSALTLVKDPDDWAETIQTTAQHTASAEPTLGDVLASAYVHPQTGHTFHFPEGIKIGGGDRLGILVTAPASVSAAVTVKGEE